MAKETEAQKKRRKAKQRQDRAAAVAREQREAEAAAIERQRRAAMPLHRKLLERWDKFWVWMGPLSRGIVRIIAVLTLLATLSVFTGPFWRKFPVFGVPEPANSPSNEVPFELSNPSVLFGMTELQLQCLIHIDAWVPVGRFNVGSAFEDAFIVDVGDIGAKSFAQVECHHDPDSPPPFQAGLGGVPVEVTEQNLIRSTRVWVNARYRLSLLGWSLPWYIESQPEVYNWLRVDPPRWVRDSVSQPP